MVETYVRKMAEIVKIEEVKSIPDADKICAYRVLDGWWVVDQVGKYQVGDLVVYVSIDSWVPTALAPFLSKGKEPREYNGVKGEKLRTIRLRKQVSQGLLLPLSVFPHSLGFSYATDKTIGEDVSVWLGIQKWEAPPEFKSTDAKGSFPSFVFKTDQERVQNCFRNVEKHFSNVTWEETEKMEGSSLTAYFKDGEFGVCSRNLNLKRSEDNTFWKTALKYDLESKLTTLGKNIAIQAELCGPGIQGNIYGLNDYMLFVFDVFDINTFSYYSPEERRALTKDLGLTDAPVLRTNVDLSLETCESMLKYADGKSVIGATGTLREGLVYKANIEERISFKCVSNSYLISSK